MRGYRNEGCGEDWVFETCGTCKHHRRLGRRGVCLIMTEIDGKHVRNATDRYEPACPRWEEAE